MTINDREYINDLKINEQLPYNKNIDKVKETVEHIKKIEHHKSNMLNFDILNYLFQNKTKEILYEMYASLITEENNYKFIQEYFNSVDNCKIEVLSDIVSRFDDNFMIYALNNSHESIFKNDILKICLTLKMLPKNCLEDKSSILFLEQSFDVFSKFFNNSNSAYIRVFVLNNYIVFKTLNTKNQFFLDAVIREKSYCINDDNIKIILSSKELISLYDTAPYTAILRSENINLIEYIDWNITDCLQNIFNNGGRNEDEGVIISLINNEHIKDEVKVKYIKQQNNRISSLGSVIPLKYNMLFTNNLVNPNWSLVNDEVFENTDFVEFLETHVSELGECKDEVIDNETLTTFIEKINISETEKINLLLNIIKNRKFNEDTMDAILRSIGGEYAKIPNKGRLAKFPNNPNNKYIIDYLWKNKYTKISSEPSEKNDEIKISTKRK